MTVEKVGTRRTTVRVLHSWHEAFASAMTQSDPRKLIGCVEDAIRALERRYSEWGTHAGTLTELAAIHAGKGRFRGHADREEIYAADLPVPPVRRGSRGCHIYRTLAFQPRQEHADP